VLSAAARAPDGRLKERNECRSRRTTSIVPFHAGRYEEYPAVRRSVGLEQFRVVNKPLLKRLVPSPEILELLGSHPTLSQYELSHLGV
jgi:hypothetical protein